MIAWLKGKLLEKKSSQIILDVNGVGYDIAISMTTFFSLPDEGEDYCCFIQTIVREDTLSLFGFSAQQEKTLFRALIKISGIGPKVALAILSSTTCDDFVRIIQQKDSKSLIKLPGIGKKTAERLLIELSDSLSELLEQNPLLDSSLNSSLSEQAQRSAAARDEAVQALSSLGYQLKQAEKVINSLDDGNKKVDELIRLGLRELSPTV